MDMHDVEIEEPVRALLRHALATIAYRTARCLEGAPPGFAAFTAGQGARTPLELVRHLNALCLFTQALLTGAPRREVEQLCWDGQVERLEAALSELDGALQTATAWHHGPEAALQGPLSDALTHVGQLALCRRLAGAPIEGANYARAPIRAGSLSLR